MTVEPKDAIVIFTLGDWLKDIASAFTTNENQNQI